MKKFILLLLFLGSSTIFATNIKNAYAIGIFDENGNGENIQHTRKTKNDYNGICYTKIFVLANSFQTNPKVSVGNSIGHFEKAESIYNNKNIKIGEVLTYKHFGVSKGYVKISLYGKVFDWKVFVK